MRKSLKIPGCSILCLAVLAFAWTGCSKAGSSTTVSAVTYLSLIHAAPYAGASTVYLNDTLITQSTGISTGAFSPKYGTIRPGSYAVKFKKAGVDSLFDQLGASSYDTLNFYTLLLYNDANKAAHAMKIFDDYSGVANSGSSYYRFFHLAPDLPAVNVYFNGTKMEFNRTSADNAISSGLNAFQPIQPGSYVVAVKDARTDSLIVQSPGINMMSGNPFTIWVTGTKAQNNLSINVFQAQY
ncbi:DUF4397 domain-containing protein [Puia sp.]|uniref:DUF4397 domain-containing protein n=1 Tax=Puia sp. TaxID=2045100 RepID=UPI002F419460